MAKKITVILVVIMLVVGFAVGLIASPFITCSKLVFNHRHCLEQHSETKVIRVGTDPTWPPYQLRDNVTGKIVGFEVDLANACAAKLGFTIEWNDVSFRQHHPFSSKWPT